MRRQHRLTSWIVGAVVAAVGWGCADPGPPSGRDVPMRIVSMAPSLTETLLALDLDDRVVGVTRYCPTVPGAVSVGGYFDPSYETILSLDPDLVIVTESHDELVRRLADLGVETLLVDQHDVSGILESIGRVATECGVPDRGQALAVRLRAELDAVSSSVSGRSRPRVLVVVGREPGTGRLGSLWAAGGDTFYNDVLALAGGVNALDASPIRYPELSVEGLFAVDPDVILDILADGGDRAVTADEAAADWRSVSELRAVREDRVHVLLDDFVVIPGPRIVETVGVFAAHLHPGIEP
jgi:iron complex transport system substrate-binding protein